MLENCFQIISKSFPTAFSKNVKISETLENNKKQLSWNVLVFHVSKTFYSAEWKPETRSKYVTWERHSTSSSLFIKFISYARQGASEGVGDQWKRYSTCNIASEKVHSLLTLSSAWLVTHITGSRIIAF